MPEIYRNGRNYSGASYPQGGLTGQALLKQSNADDDVYWGDVKGIVFTYIVGSTPLASDWLSLTVSGTALTPDPGMVYLIVSEGEYYNNFVRWDATNLTYIVISSGGSGTLLTGTLLSSGWSNKTQTVSVAGVKSTTVGIIGLLNTVSQAQFDAACEAGIRVTSVSTNQITFTCETVPDINIPFGVIIGLGGGSGGSGGANNFVKGYLYNGAFYEEPVHETQIDGEEDKIYLDIPNEKCYEFDGFVYNRIDDETIKKDALPTASSDNVGEIYMYSGPTGNDFTHGYFYECINNGGTYSWVELSVMQGGHNIKNDAGTSMNKRANLQFMGGAKVSDDLVNDATVVETEQIQFSTVPTASASLLNKVIQFTGTTSGSFKNGLFYKCIEDPDNAGSYVWVNVPVNDIDSALSDSSENAVQNKIVKSAVDKKQDKEFVGTHLSWAALTDEEKAEFTLVNFTDDSLTEKISTALGSTPVGTIISVMGVTAPANYLACDGSEHLIGSYPELANYFEVQFGTKNHFGGNGTTTFAVPDLRGEFLRGTGINSHSHSGDGGSVGEHQAATGINPGWVNNQAGGFSLSVVPSSDYSSLVCDNGDKYVSTGTRKSIASSTNLKQIADTASNAGYWTIRPTNTSVLYCIAVKNIFVDPSLNYSTEEQVVGRWVDGKTIYQKTIDFGALPNNTTKSVNHNIQNIDYIVNLFGVAYRSTDGVINTLPCYNHNIYGAELVSNPTSILVTTFTDRSAFSKSYITIQYTKITA